MKKLLFTVAFMVGVSMFAQTASPNANEQGKSKSAKSKGKGGKGKGQEKKNMTPEERADKVSNRMKTELGLTDDQATKVKAITLTRATKMAEIRTKAKTEGADKTALKAERKATHQAWEADLKGIVSAEQFAKYQAKKEERKKKLEERKKNAGKKENDAAKEGEETIEELEEEVGE